MARAPTVPRTRNWKAVEISDIIGRNSWLIVAGEVQVTNTNQVPKLSVRVPQGINPRILLLNLKIARSGIGLPFLLFKQVLYVRRIRPGQYTEVDIFFGRRMIKRIRVRRILSLRAAAKKKKAARRKKRQ